LPTVLGGKRKQARERENRAEAKHNKAEGVRLIVWGHNNVARNGGDKGGGCLQPSLKKKGVESKGPWGFLEKKVCEQKTNSGSKVGGWGKKKFRKGHGRNEKTKLGGWG